MIGRLLKLPFAIVGLLIRSAMTLAMFEGPGLFVYLQWQHEGALAELTAGGVTLGEVVTFLQSYPDVLGVAVLLGIVALFVSSRGTTSGRGHHDDMGWDGDDGDGGGLGGFGGGFGGDGGDGGGGDGGGGE